jgi:hypothetical protein
MEERSEEERERREVVMVVSSLLLSGFSEPGVHRLGEYRLPQRGKGGAVAGELSRRDIDRRG